MNRKNVQFKKYILHCQNDIGNEIRCVGDKKFWLHFRHQYLTSIILVLVWFQFHSEIVIHSKCQTSRIVIHHPLTLAIKIQMVHMHFKIDIITHVTCGMFQLCWFKTFDINMKIFSAEPFWPKLFHNIPFSFLLINRWSLKIYLPLYLSSTFSKSTWSTHLISCQKDAIYFLSMNYKKAFRNMGFVLWQP